jgi:hypothetical protein
MQLEADDFGGDDSEDDVEGNLLNDHEIKNFLEDLQKVGPYSKQILNYSYPPLLYQRGDDEDEDEEGDENFDEEMMMH